MNPALKHTTKWVGTFIATVVLAIAIYLFAVLNVYIIAWVVALIQWIFG
ncbi:MAG TPA: hypothetical protein PKE32_06230 [Miltoncostaeaceae bacterium]|nr:hypothetical protein [Miltoncostaeaceae bacterium]